MLVNYSGDDFDIRNLCFIQKKIYLQQDYPEQSALNDSLGFMKGPIIGGQFNVYPSKLHRKVS